jgi:hypothetical protein
LCRHATGAIQCAKSGAAPSADAAHAEDDMKAPLLLLVLICTSASAIAAQQVYSWTDANGVKHFTDSPPPPNVNAQKIHVRGSVTSEDAAPAASPADEEPAPNSPPPAQTQKISSALADSPENRAKQCQTAKSNVQILQGSYPVSAPPGADGKAQVLDEKGRKDAVARANEQVTFYCR